MAYRNFHGMTSSQVHSKKLLGRLFKLIQHAAWCSFYSMCSTFLWWNTLNFYRTPAQVLPQHHVDHVLIRSPRHRASGCSIFLWKKVRKSHIILIGCFHSRCVAFLCFNATPFITSWYFLWLAAIHCLFLALNSHSWQTFHHPHIKTL